MTKEQKIAFKKSLHQKCIEIIEQRINSAALAMDNAQEAANSESKSSAGDKYETSRAMNHLEKDMHAKQLAANRQELAALMAINCEQVHEQVITGSIIKCIGESFFIAAGLGKMNYNGEQFFLLSPNAPVAKLLIGQKVGDAIQFNNKTVMIRDVY